MIERDFEGLVYNEDEENQDDQDDLDQLQQELEYEMMYSVRKYPMYFAFLRYSYWYLGILYRKRWYIRTRSG